jgi:hypothetical protein
MAEMKRLNLDLEALFPGDILEIGDNKIDIRPLGVLKLVTISKKLKTLIKNLTDEGVTWENYSTPENIFKIATILLEHAPESLSEASGIHIEDINVLPIEEIIRIIDKVVEVNLKSKGTLEKNFKSLTSKFEQKTKKK